MPCPYLANRKGDEGANGAKPRASRRQLRQSSVSVHTTILGLYGGRSRSRWYGRAKQTHVAGPLTDVSIPLLSSGPLRD